MSDVRALLLERDGDGPIHARVADLRRDELPGGSAPAPGEVEIAVSHSALNYKDALIVTGTGAPLVRTHPHVPGIDLAGTVTAIGADVPTDVATVGDEVLVTGCGLGERRWGGMATAARVPAAWLVRRPAGLDAARAMALGTAGFTAQLCVDALGHGGVVPGAGPVLVTGAAGGVGGLAVHLLVAAGHEVVAATGTPDAAPRLRALGAADVIDRSELAALADRPLASGRWAGAVDVVGGAVLAGTLVATLPSGVVAACGLAGGRRLDVDLAPFFVRGVVLAGIDSVLHPMAERPGIWSRLAATVDRAALDGMTTTVGVDAVPGAAADLLAHGGRGRTVVMTGATTAADGPAAP